ncbi:MAG: DUF4080 domain-containing protein [Acidiferrobacterales bacterium]|nr:DUF4080 domain-containing protein [Acidiferrobacterales bacterium]
MIKTTPTISDENSTIVLSTLNARYIHSAFGLRYLKANLEDLQDQCEIQEFTLESRPEDVVESILSSHPKIVGFGVYIWNVVQTERVLALLKAVAPDIVVVLGGPEVSYEIETQNIVSLSDYVITGWGDVSFRKLCSDLLNSKQPSEPIIAGEQPKLQDIVMPYDLYTNDDIKNRVLYVEASRGCPFKCEFCLSALDKTAWPFELDLFLGKMDELYQRGARHFKFVDRTFNLKVKNSLKILAFFLERMDGDLFLHFELIPDHLPEALKSQIVKFPAGSLQFEIGIQTFNPEVQERISRRQDNQLAQENIRWIRDNTYAYVHADLIFGLPGEDLDSFAESFDRLYELSPHEIQVGILKRLKGSPIVRHTQAHRLVFNPNPPFSIVSSDTVDYLTVQSINRFARYWDLIANSGRFNLSLPLLLVDKPFINFERVTRALFNRTGQTHKISLLRLYDLIFLIAVEEFDLDEGVIREAIQQDFTKSGLKSIPKCLTSLPSQSRVAKAKSRRNARQIRH